MEEKKIIDLFFARSELAIELCRVHYGAYCRTIARNILDSDSIAELSERFDMTPGRVKTALFRIRKKLREDLIKEGYLCE